MSDDNPTIEPAPFERADTRQRGPRFVLKPLPLSIGAVFVVLALAALFMFNARAVRFDIDPAPASLTVMEGLFSWRLGERFLMLPGTYTIKASREGYFDLEKQVKVGEEADQEFSFAMKKLPGILTIETSPVENARVYIDQEMAGTTPLELEQIEAGLHDVRIEADRYLPFYTEVKIEGMRKQQRLQATLEPGWAKVGIRSMPPEADIIIDDEQRATTPATLEILQGEHQVKVSKPGYKIWQSHLEVTAGEDRQLPPIELIKADGRISVITDPEGANVTIGGRYRGQSPLEVSLAPGKSYRILLSKAGYRPEERTLTVEADEDIQLEVSLSPVLGTVRIQVQPEGGKLFVDGEPRGEPSRKLTLTASEHDIRIEKEGYATYRTTVTPQPGITRQLMVTLKTEEQARIAAIPQSVTTPLDQTLKLIIPDRMTMGADRREPGRRSNEVQKEVKLTRPYYLGVNEVTNKAYTEFDPDHEPGILGRALLDRDDRPVVNVTWAEAVKFCNWLSEKEGLPVAYRQADGKWRLIEPATTGYRLPTEAEWAWAARYAGDGQPTRFPWGEQMPPPEGFGNFADESAANMAPYHIKGYNDQFRGPAPVGSFPANAFGIHDLAGNAAEWVHDYYSIGFSRELLVDPTGPDSGDYHVIRGSSYMHGRFSELRWTFRDYGDKPRPDVGFRIARFVE